MRDGATVVVEFTPAEARAVRRAAELLAMVSEGHAPGDWRAEELRAGQAQLVSAMERAGVEHEVSLVSLIEEVHDVDAA